MQTAGMLILKNNIIIIDYLVLIQIEIVLSKIKNNQWL